MARLSQAHIDRASLARFGEPAEYRVGGLGDAWPVEVIDIQDAQAVGQSGLLELRRELYVARADLAEPARGDSLTLESGEVLIVQQFERDGALWRLIVRRGGS